jgi:hypothetical protein
MIVRNKYEQERIIRHKYKKEKNIIQVSKRGRGYCITFVDNNFINSEQDNRQETYPFFEVKDGDYCEVLDSLTHFSSLFYDKGIILSFGEGAEIIPEKEKLTLMKVIQRLENLSISHSNLLSNISSISKFLDNSQIDGAKELHKFNCNLTETEEE